MVVIAGSPPMSPAGSKPRLGSTDANCTGVLTGRPAAGAGPGAASAGAASRAPASTVDAVSGRIKRWLRDTGGPPTTPPIASLSCELVTQTIRTIAFRVYSQDWPIRRN